MSRYHTDDRRPPLAAHCNRCLARFPDIWGLKAHQDECLPQPGGAR